MIRFLSIILFCVFFLARAYAGIYTYQRVGGVVCSWSPKDVICTFTEMGSCMRMWQESLVGDGHSSSFTLNGWALVPNGKFIAVSPYCPVFSSETAKAESLPVSYAAQEQTGNDNAAHLTSCDFMTASAQPSNDALNFDFKHLGCVMRISCPVYESMVVDSIMLTTDRASFVKDAIINAAEGTLTASAKDVVQTLRMKDVELEKGDTLVAYLILAPVDLRNQSLTITVKSQTGDKLMKAKGANMLAGKCYVLDATQENVTTLQTEARIRNGANELTANNITSPTAKIPDFPLDSDNMFVLEVLENGISNIVAEPKVVATYSLSGMRINPRSLPKGTIYICNGKKYMVR